MIKRIVEINQPSWLSIKNKQLCVEQNKIQVARIPVEDMGILLLVNPAITLTQAVVIHCQQHNAIIIFCNRKFLPYSIILPISEGHTLHQKLLKQQILLSKSRQETLWKQIVKCKIGQQIETLKWAEKPTIQLERMQLKVQAGDIANIEAQAARRYWRLLFGVEFKRNQNAEGINALLNYGYALMRALIARAIVSAGLHPALGLHHSNQYNSLCLADDLMEPLRPWVDKLVWELAQQGQELEVCTATKQPFLELLSAPVQWKKTKLPLLTASHYCLAQLKKCYVDSRIKMEFPKWHGNLHNL